VHPGGTPRELRRRRWTAPLAAGFGLCLATGLLPGWAGAAPPPPVTLAVSRGPAPGYACAYDAVTQAYTGAHATASAVGWEGNHRGVVTCLGGSFTVQAPINRAYGFGIYNGSPTQWQDLDGYLPAQITTFQRAGLDIAITEFADRIELGGHRYVALYSRVAVDNPTADTVVADPGASSGLVPLQGAPDAVPPHGHADHDYVLAVDRFGTDAPWPTAAALAGAGSFDAHLRHMESFWNGQLTGIAAIRVPDSALVDAYKSGFITTQIARSGNHLDTGVNNYESEFSHDVIGILTNLLIQGDDADAHALLLEARDVVGAQGQYDDGIWTYAWPWAVYLMKTGDLAFVRANFDTEGPQGSAQPSIEDSAHLIAADRTGPSGIMEATDDIDTDGYWTVDDYEALTGLAAYRYLAGRIGDSAEETWATAQYDSLLAATTAVLDQTIAADHLDYLPCSMVQPNTANRCSNPEDANWAAPFQFGKWAWEAQVFGAPVSGPGLSLIDATYDYGFQRLSGLLPPDTFGGFPSDYYSSAYNAAYGTWGLASLDHRDQGILSYQFMIARTQSGPNSWWESSGPPDPSDPWTGSHPGAGQGSSPHAWGMAEADMVLLDSIVTERADGSLVVGTGLPPTWLGGGRVVAVTNFPTTGGGRASVTISGRARTVTLRLGGSLPSGPVQFDPGSFIDNVATTSTGTVDESTGTVTIPTGTTVVTVELRHPPGG
jgi:hypothetical protein